MLSNDTDQEEHALSVTTWSAPQHGTLVRDGDGRFRYTPEPSYWGLDDFTYSIDDGRSGTDEGTVTFWVHPNPLPQGDAYTAYANEPLEVPSRGVLANDEDPEDPTGAALTVSETVNQRTDHGYVTLRAGGGFTYVPDQGYHGEDGFDYTVRNAYGQATGRVTIDVEEAAAGADEYAMLKGTTLSVGVDRALVRNDHGRWSFLRIVTGPTHGQLLDFDDEQGTFTYQATVDTDEPDFFTYALVRDDGTEAAQATATMKKGDPDLTKVWQVGGSGMSLRKDNGESIDGKWEDENGDGTDDAGDTAEVFAVKADTRMSLNVHIAFKNDFNPEKVAIRGRATSGSLNGEAVVLEWEDTLRKIGSVWGSLMDSKAETKLPAEVGVIDDLKIKWEVRIDDQTEWVEAGVSRFEKVYVTRGQTATNPYETVVALGTEALAGQASTIGDDEAVNLIWNKFAGFDLRRVSDDLRITYWANWSPLPDNLPGLLASDDADGRCGAIAELFRETISVQGITDAKISQVTPLENSVVNDKSTYGFFVKHWQFDAQGMLEGAADAFTHVFVWRNAKDWANGNAYDFRYSDGTDLSGTSGQGNVPNPHSIFFDHEVVRIGTRFYDPSYGMVYNDLHDMQNRAFDGVFRIQTNIWLSERQTLEDFDDDGILEDSETRLFAKAFVVKPTAAYSSELLLHVVRER